MMMQGDEVNVDLRSALKKARGWGSEHKRRFASRRSRDVFSFLTEGRQSVYVQILVVGGIGSWKK